MRKFIAIFFLLIYANVGLAMAFNFHHCNGHISKISLAQTHFHASCCCKNKSMDKDCCKDETMLLKAGHHQGQASQETPAADFRVLAMAAMLPLHEPAYYFPHDHAAILLNSQQRNSRVADIFLAIRNLRI